MQHHRPAIAWPMAALAAMALTWPAAAQDETTARLTVSEKEPFGQYVADGQGQGMSLYMLEADTQGGPDSAATSTCYDECAQEWPPFIASGSPGAGEQVDESLISTIERKDGAMQVTYNGWPLYYYHDDKEPGDTTGQGVHDKWGGWYLVAPSGEPIETEE